MKNLKSLLIVLSAFIVIGAVMAFEMYAGK